jgi:hypothetical protein
MIVNMNDLKIVAEDEDDIKDDDIKIFGVIVSRVPNENYTSN